MSVCPFVCVHTCEKDFVIPGKAKQTIFAMVLKAALAAAVHADLGLLAILQLMAIFHPQPPKCWDYMRATSCWAQRELLISKARLK